MMVATKVAIAATILQLLLMKVLKMKIQPMHWFSFALILILGSMSIFFNNPRFLQWKFSILEWLMGSAILIGQLVFKKNMFKLLMGNELSLPEPIWKKMAWLWARRSCFSTGNWRPISRIAASRPDSWRPRCAPARSASSSTGRCMSAPSPEWTWNGARSRSSATSAGATGSGCWRARTWPAPPRRRSVPISATSRARSA